ncbi:hypothetical protein [Chania multitudinisentens]|uniref:hypothetical protein n=1 Tax=Chania multitudinisentens TaxID=1639108 RepID=UPI0003E14A79|nr:hypothetical protein [Chania multitudinisentens]
MGGNFDGTRGDAGNGIGIPEETPESEPLEVTEPGISEESVLGEIEPEDEAKE